MFAGRIREVRVDEVKSSASVLALRQMKTTLWELTSASQIRKHYPELRQQMLPDELVRKVNP